MRATRHFAFWCTKCPTRIKLETEAEDDDGYLGDVVALARVKPPEIGGDDGLDVAEHCPLCGGMLATSEDLYVLERAIPRTWAPEDEPRLHQKALEVLRTREREKEPKS